MPFAKHSRHIFKMNRQNPNTNQLPSATRLLDELLVLGRSLTLASGEERMRLLAQSQESFALLDQVGVLHPQNSERIAALVDELQSNFEKLASLPVEQPRFGKKRSSDFCCVCSNQITVVPLPSIGRDYAVRFCSFCDDLFMDTLIKLKSTSCGFGVDYD